MAQQYDVPARLDEGREAVAHTQTYVAACYRLGYRHPDLTGYDGQLVDRYASEAGLDLRRLDADCAALGALADAADDALRTQRRGLAELSDSWRGPAAGAATEFLRRHCDAGAELTARLRAAVAGCGVLRDEVWRLVDAKVAAVLAVDDRVGAGRPAWLAAAHAVNSGANDPHAAEVIEQQVIPHVDNDVRGEWLAAVRSAKDGIDAAYRAAVATADPGTGAVFAIPGELGPIAQLDPPVSVSPVVVAAPVPADSPPVNPPPAPGELAGAAAPDPAPAPETLPAEPGLPAGLGLPGDLGGGLPTGGLGGLSGLGGLIPRLANAFGDDGLGNPMGEPFHDDTSTGGLPDDGEDHEPDELEGESEPAAEEAEAAEPGEDEPADETGAAAEPESESEPAGEAVATEGTGGAEQALPPADVSPKTPCEIAADELPQVGE